MRGEGEAAGQRGRGSMGADAADPRLAEAAVERASRRAARRLLPFLLLMYVVAFLDRTNIAFAKAALEFHLGIGAKEYALAAGLFFLSYAGLEIPSNLALHRVGARVWMARIMVSWGLISACMAFVVGSKSLYVLRLLLGAAEAGFFPGVILYLTHWFPARQHARILGLFYFGAPLAFVIGSPVSGALLGMGDWGMLAGWQWMFVAEGLLAAVIGVCAFWLLDNRPAEAKWLSAEERDALESALAAEHRERSAHGPAELIELMRDRHVLHFALIYALIQASVYGVVFYLPSEVANLLHSEAGLRVGLFSAIPWVCALAGAYWVPRLAGSGRRSRAVAVATLLIAGLAGFLLSAPWHGVVFAALSIAATGFIAVQPIFWTFPTGYLTGRAAAAGIALVNAVGALGGFVAPNIKEWGDAAFKSSQAGTWMLAGLSVLGAVLIAALRVRSETEKGAASGVEAG